MNSFYDYLKTRLEQELPGHATQLEMAPRPNEGRTPYLPDGTDANISAVLILLYRTNRLTYNVLLTLRSELLPTHKGQISFPGGRVGENESIIDAALRETHEEVGVSPEIIRVLGRITGLYLPNSKNYIYPVVGYSDQKPSLRINEDEVQEAFFVSLDELLNPDNVKTTRWQLHNKPYKVPYWDIHETTPLWGATAMIVNEFVTIYKEFKEKNMQADG